MAPITDPQRQKPVQLVGRRELGQPGGDGERGRVSSQGDADVSEVIQMVTEPCDGPKSHEIVRFKWVDRMACEPHHQVLWGRGAHTQRKPSVGHHRGVLQEQGVRSAGPLHPEPETATGSLLPHLTTEGGLANLDSQEGQRHRQPTHCVHPQ